MMPSEEGKPGQIDLASSCSLSHIKICLEDEDSAAALCMAESGARSLPGGRRESLHAFARESEIFVWSPFAPQTKSAGHDRHNYNFIATDFWNTSGAQAFD